MTASATLAGLLALGGPRGAGSVQQPAAAAKSAPAAAGRVVHVSPQPLANVGPDRPQFRTIREATKVVRPGDTVQIHSGTYRESVVVETSGTRERPIRFEAALGANVVITGADRLLEWTRDPAAGPGENVFFAPWPHEFISWSKTRTHPGDDYHAVIGRAEQVHVDGYPLPQVLGRDRLSRGTFFADTAAKRLYVWAANNAELGADVAFSPRVEASVRPVLWEAKGDYIIVRGLRLRYAANHAQQAAAQFKGRSNIVSDCVFERMNSIGAAFIGPDQVARRCTFQDNGQMGWGAARAHNLLVSGCLTRNNNTKNFSRGWEAGGNKIVLSRNVVIEQSRFEANRGNGIWFDIGNENATVRNCLIADNEDAGIFYEISYGLHARDNVIIGNGLSANGGAWGAASGISLSSSPGCVIERNLLIGNKEGFNFREQARTTPRIDASAGAPEVAVWNHDQILRNNVLARNRDAQTWGWFDVNDERHWPKAMQQVKTETGQAMADIAKDYGARDKSGQPAGLSLETLKIAFSNNLYDPGDGGGAALFHWGTSWKRNKAYPTLAAARAELGLEQGSRVATFTFAGYLSRDFRVPAGSPAFTMGCYPRGSVPGVRLGVLDNSARQKQVWR